MRWFNHLPEHGVLDVTYEALPSKAYEHSTATIAIAKLLRIHHPRREARATFFLNLGARRRRTAEGPAADLKGAQRRVSPETFPTPPSDSI